MYMEKLKLFKDNILYVVVPSYNEEPVLRDTSNKLKSILEELIGNELISPLSKVMFVNDGSKDKTWDIIKELHDSNEIFTGISLSRNKGHQNALLAGLFSAVEAGATTTISIDADLQDDPVCISLMIAKYNEENEVVYGVRNDRASDSPFKRVTAQAYYKTMKFMGVELQYNSADCRLLSSRAVNALNEFKEVNLFIRGIIPLIGFKSARVEYTRNPRLAGTSKYNLGKMLALANEGITSFSVKPLKLITFIGLVFLFGGLITFITLLCIQNYIFYSIFGAIFFATGVILIALGVVGNYIGKIYLEVKKRPRYFIEENLEEKTN